MASGINDIEREHSQPTSLNVETQKTTIQHSLSCGNISFLKQIEKQASVTIPDYIKNLLILTGFDNAISFRKLNEDRLLSIENFAKKHLICITEPNDKLKDYYGIFHNCLSQFRILEGHKIMILEIASQFKRDPESFIITNSQSPVHESLEYMGPFIKRRKTIESPTPIDLENEKQVLLRMTNNWIEAHRINIVTDVDVEVVEIKVSAVELNDENDEHLTQMFGYKAEITCPVCKKIYQTHKVKIRGTNNRRWITSNFQKHIKLSHFCDRNESFSDIIKEEPEEYSNLSGNYENLVMPLSTHDM